MIIQKTKKYVVPSVAAAGAGRNRHTTQQRKDFVQCLQEQKKI